MKIYNTLSTPRMKINVLIKLRGKDVFCKFEGKSGNAANLGCRDWVLV
jgi:hypothetical protein